MFTLPTIFFPILKQCKQVTYAFKTPLPLPHPPKSLSSYFLGETSLRFCNCFCARGLQAAEKRLGLGKGGGPNDTPHLPLQCPLGCPLLPALGLILPPEGREAIQPFLQILGVASIPSLHLLPTWKLCD